MQAHFQLSLVVNFDTRIFIYYLYYFLLERIKPFLLLQLSTRLMKNQIEGLSKLIFYQNNNTEKDHHLGNSILDFNFNFFFLV